MYYLIQCLVIEVIIRNQCQENACFLVTCVLFEITSLYQKKKIFKRYPFLDRIFEVNRFEEELDQIFFNYYRSLILSIGENLIFQNIITRLVILLVKMTVVTLK